MHDERYLAMLAAAPENLRTRGYTLSPLGEKVALVLSMLYGGIHNYRAHAKVVWADPYCVEVPICKNLSTHDPEYLLVLVATSAALGLRLTLDVRGRSMIAQFHTITEAGMPRPSDGAAVIAATQHTLARWAERAEAVLAMRAAPEAVASGSDHDAVGEQLYRYDDHFRVCVDALRTSAVLSGDAWPDGSHVALLSAILAERGVHASIIALRLVRWATALDWTVEA